MCQQPLCEGHTAETRHRTSSVLGTVVSSVALHRCAAHATPVIDRATEEREVADALAAQRRRFEEAIAALLAAGHAPHPRRTIEHVKGRLGGTRPVHRDLEPAWPIGQQPWTSTKPDVTEPHLFETGVTAEGRLVPIELDPPEGRGRMSPPSFECAIEPLERLVSVPTETPRSQPRRRSARQHEREARTWARRREKVIALGYEATSAERSFGTNHPRTVAARERHEAAQRELGPAPEV